MVEKISPPIFVEEPPKIPSTQTKSPLSAEKISPMMAKIWVAVIHASNASHASSDAIGCRVHHNSCTGKKLPMNWLSTAQLITTACPCIQPLFVYSTARMASIARMKYGDRYGGSLSNRSPQCIFPVSFLRSKQGENSESELWPKWQKIFLRLARLALAHRPLTQHRLTTGNPLLKP